MRIRRGIVKVIKWCGPVVAVVIALVWGWSVGRNFTLNMPAGISVSIDPGTFSFGFDADIEGSGPSYPTGTRSSVAPHEWWFLSYWSARYWWVSIPLWLPCIAAGGVSAMIWRNEIRARRLVKLGHCPKCHYSRAGLTPAATCPECGSAAPAQ